MKFNVSFNFLMGCLLFVFCTSAHAKTENSEQKILTMAKHLAEIDVIFKNCVFDKKDRDVQVNLFRIQKDFEYYYWEFVGCEMEYEQGQMILDSENYSASKAEPVLTGGDYDKICPERIKNISEKISKIMQTPLPKCEEWQDEGL